MAQPVSLLEKELELGREKLPIGWPWRLLTFTAIVLGLAVVLYLGMAVGYRPYLDSRIADLDARLTEVSQSVGEGRASELRRFYSRLTNAETILKERTIATRILSLIEGTLHRDLTLTGLDIQAGTRTVKLLGLAASYEVLGQELTFLGARREVQAVFLDESSLRDQGNLQFAIRLIMTPDSFKE